MAVPVEGAGRNKRWAAAGSWVFCAHPTRLETGIWHGFPVIGSEVPERVLVALEASGQIDRRDRRRLAGQRALPPAWP